MESINKMTWKHYLNPVVLLIAGIKKAYSVLSKTPVWLLLGIAAILVGVGLFGVFL
jgi:hypothetical protein